MIVAVQLIQIALDKPWKLVPEKKKATELNTMRQNLWWPDSDLCWPVLHIKHECTDSRRASLLAIHFFCSRWLVLPKSLNWERSIIAERYAQFGIGCIQESLGRKLFVLARAYTAQMATNEAVFHVHLVHSQSMGTTCAHTSHKHIRARTHTRTHVE